MKRRSTLFLKGVISLIAVGAAAALIRFPQTEGRAAHLDIVSIYRDPFIIYLYITSIPFFVALYQTIKLLGFVEKHTIFSKAAVQAVKTIKYCAMTFIGLFAAAVAYILVLAKLAPHADDDPAGFVVVGFVVIFAAAVIATAVAVFQKLLQSAVDIKSENDLTV